MAFACSIAFQRLRCVSISSSSLSISKSVATSTFVASRSINTRFNDHLTNTLNEVKAAGTYKKERVITSPQNAQITVQENPKPVLNFCANNYLGLSDHPEIVKAAEKALHSHGVGLSSVRFICGTQNIHKQLESTIASFHKKEDAILFPSCFDANGGIFEALFAAEDAIISDELNHASIIDGIRLSKAQRYRYKHLDMSDLEEQLKKAQEQRFRVIATDGAFSMDGDVAPLPKICDLAEKYDALVFIDECHCTGFIGPTGRGTPEYFGVENRIDIINSTLGKAMGGATGGYTASTKNIVDMLRQRARPYLFSNSVAPSVVGASLKAYEMLTNDPSLLKRLSGNVKLFREGMTKAGFKVLGDPTHPIAPVLLGDAKLATDMANALLKRGIYVIGFSFPVVPKGQARIRVQLSAVHELSQVQQCIDAFVQVGKEFNVIK